MKLVLRFMVLMLFCIGTIVYGHGFSADTLVLLSNNTYQRMDDFAKRSLKKKITLASYDCGCETYVISTIERAGRSTTNCYIVLRIAGYDDCITCTPDQQFYHAHNKQWIKALELTPGVELVSCNGTKIVQSIFLVSNSLQIYALRIIKTHTYFVGSAELLTHNICLPLVASIGMSIPFGSVAGSVAGFFGPATFVAGIALGALAMVAKAVIEKSSFASYNVASYDVAFLNQQISYKAQHSFAPAYVSKVEDQIQQQKNTVQQTVIIVEPEREVVGCGNSIPEMPLICITPITPMPVFENPGFFVLPEEQKKLLLGGGGCKGIPIIEITKEDLFHTMTVEEAQKRWAESEKMNEFQNRFVDLVKIVDKTKPRSYLSYENLPKIEKALAEGENMWQKIRANNDDVERIASNIGLSKEIVSVIKEHVFYLEHIKNLGVAPFDSDYDMAKAWERLVNNDFVYADLEFLRHELAESILMGNKILPYDVAHKIVEQFFDWAKQLEGY